MLSLAPSEAKRLGNVVRFVMTQYYGSWDRAAAGLGIHDELLQRAAQRSASTRLKRSTLDRLGLALGLDVSKWGGE